MNTKKKRTPKQKKKAIVSVLLMVAILITGAFAFLSATDSKTNVFTVGNVKIKLSEEFDTNQNGSIEKTNDENDEVYDASETQVSLKGEILPGQKVIKRPYVENMGKNKAWVYITVGIPTTNSDNTFRNKDTGETSITGQNVDIPIQAYAIQENYANKTTYKDVWNAYFADKVTDTFGAEVTDAKTLSERVPLFEILNKTRFNEPIPDNISVDDNIPNDDWENIGITVGGQEKSYYKSANYDYYVFAYKTLLDPTADGAEQLNRTSDVFEGVRLLKDIGEAQPSKLNYYIKETAGNTLNGEVDLSVEASTYDGYRLVKTEYYMPGERVRNLYYDDTLAETGYSFNWNFMNDKTKSAYSGMIITQDTDLVATYEDTVSDVPKEPTEVPVVKYSPSGYLGYAIEKNDDGSYYATLIGADETRSDYPEAPTEVLVPNAIKILENSDGTKLLEDGVIMHGSIDDFPGGTQIPVKKIQLAEWQWDPSTNDYAAPEAVALGKIAKKLNIAGSNIEEIKFCGDIYKHNITSGFVLEDVGEIPFSCKILNDRAFSNCVNLKRCTIPNSLASIGNNAFDGCKALTNINIPDNVTHIGKLAFKNCTSLKRVSITDIAKWCDISFGDSPFPCSHNLYIENIAITKLVIPAEVTNINSWAFSNCSSLSYVIISDSVKNIGDSAFYGCTALMSATVPDSITNIGNGAFRNCTSLRSITIPENVTRIEDYTFANCKSFTDITIPSKVSSIGQNAFDSCKGLTGITIPNGVTSIGNNAFQYCYGLTKIAIPESVTQIGDAAFSRCDKLSSIVVAKNNSKYDSRNNCNAIIETATNKLVKGCNKTIIPNGITSIEAEAFAGCANLTDMANIIIPNSVTSIGNNAFWASGLTSITIPDSVINIGDSAFEKCGSLKKVSIGKNVTNIGTKAFAESNINSIVIPNGVKSIAPETFYKCTILVSATLPNSVTSIGREAFSECWSLKNVTISDNVTSIEPMVFWSCKKLTNIIIPDSVTSIANSAFAQSGLTNITIPASVTNIEDGAFSGCYSLATISVDKNNKTYDSRNNCNAIIETATNTLIKGSSSTIIPDDVTGIGDSAFAQCQGLTSITVPKNITNIGKGAFRLCANLTSVTLPEGIKEISSNTFWTCTKLTKVNIPNSVTSIGKYAFQGCYALTDITIPDSVTNIGQGAFASSGLANVTLPSKLTNIDKQVFEATDLTNVIIPNGVTTIGENAFNACSKLTSVTIPVSATKIGWQAFTNSGTNFVYQGSLSEWAKVTCPQYSIPTGAKITCTDGIAIAQ